MQTRKRRVEVFSAGCPCCEEVITEIKKAACPSCDVIVLDMRNADVAMRAKQLGVRSVPAVAIDGTLVGSGHGPDMELLRAAGLGAPLP